MSLAAGWHRFAWNEAVARWAEHAAGAAAVAMADPKNAGWYRGEGTWFVGVDCLPNDADGRLPGGPPLNGAFRGVIPDGALHPAQISAVFPGYPRPVEGESEAASRYRRVRDGAHVDGLLPVGLERRRRMQEPHRYILGLPLTENAPGASPLVVWEGSHEILRRAFAEALEPHPREAWHEVDLTDIYQATRREVFDICQRVELPGQVGEAVLLDPMILHGIAPWSSEETGPRVVAYFRPQTDIATWLRGAHAWFPDG